MMGMVFYDLSPEELCDLMCGEVEQESEDDGEPQEYQDRVTYR